jgi:glycosyltransferase involved in cell wall biosynthesis
MDSSGYATAARNNIAALHQVGTDLETEVISFEGKKTQLGKLGHIASSLRAKNPSTGGIRILHATPPNYPGLVRTPAYHVGYATWEASRLPEEWVDPINSLDEIWVPSSYNVEVFKDSGVTIPVFLMPHTFEVTDKKDPQDRSIIQNIRQEDFLFYSIFQWLERKHPHGLLKAYFTEFQHDEPVALLIKTFRIQPGQAQDTDAIRSIIQEIKSTLRLPAYPRIVLISQLLSSQQVEAIHIRGDCYVSLHRAEGFGIPLVEAMLHENPVVGTDYSGSSDFLTEDTGYPVKYMLTPVSGMPWHMYKGNMLWAEPDLMHARQQMRQVFQDQEEAKSKAVAGRQWIKENLNWKTVGERMKKRLIEIQGAING